MKPIEIIANDLFDKVRSRFTNLQMGDEEGAVTADPNEARFFDFDFAIEGNTLGRVSISINETGNLKIYYSQGITENADSITQSLWYDFLKEMRFFAKRRLLRFDTRDITKGNLDKTDFQYLAQNGNKDPNMNESKVVTSGTKMTTRRKLDDCQMVIRHESAVDETVPGARSRKIKNIFIQNKDGERFKFPFTYLPGARAMQRHVANGGYPHDEVGKHIVETCGKILQLSDFGRKVKSPSINPAAHGIIEQAGQKLKQLRHHMESMSKQGYYESWRESYAPQDDLVEIDDATMESYKDAFTINKFDEALSDVFPLLHSIMQEAGTVDLEDYVSESQQDEEIAEVDESSDDEFAAFESWTEDLVGEGFSDQELQALQPLVQEPLQVGASDEAVQALAGVGIKDPALVNALRAVAAMPNGANADARETIKTFLGADAAKLNWGAEPAAAATPAQQPQEPAMAEGGIPGNVPAEKIPGKEDLLKGKGRQTYETFMGPEDFPEWLKDAAHRVAHGKVADWTELYAELTQELGMEDNKAERIAKRIYDHDTLAQHRVKPTDDSDITPDADVGNDDEFDSGMSDDDFVNQAKQNVGYRPEMDEDDIDPETGDDTLIEPEAPKSSAKEIAEIVMGFYDREKGTWPKGEHGVVTHVKRQFSDEEGNGGEKEAAMAAKLIQHLNSKHPGQQNDEQFAEMRKLAGLPIK